jgi:transcriptional regulator with XRE-family HTH domain
MRRSGLKHTVAVLRSVIGVGQKELAALVDCSPATIQSIELNSGRLKLSESLAERISHETGVDLNWLLSNDTRKQPTAFGGKPYTKQSFEERRAKFNKIYEPLTELRADGLEVAAETLLVDFWGTWLAGARKGKLKLSIYKFCRALQDIRKDMGITREEFVVELRKFNSVNAGLMRPPTGKRGHEAKKITDVFLAEMKRLTIPAKRDSASA